MSDIGILIVDDDIATQRALKNVLDTEGWRVKTVPLASEALPELATGAWNLAIVNVAQAEPRSTLFGFLRELASLDPLSAADPQAKPGRVFRVLFLVPILLAKDVQPYFEELGIPYSLKPYHLHDFLEKVSDLLQEAGAIPRPIRGLGGLSGKRTRLQAERSSRNQRGGSMFASRDDYMMTEEEIAEFERQEEAARQKRKKDSRDTGFF